MSSEGDITPDHAAVIRRITIAALLAHRLPNRLSGERETEYVARAIRPVVASALQKYPELVCHGEGGLRAHEVYFAGFTFIPDVSVSHLQQRILAIEAKFLVAGQDSISEALGQASIYAFAGYLSSIALVLRSAGPALQDSLQITRSDNSVNFVDLLLLRTVFE